MKILTKIRVEFSDLRDHRYNHNFNCENPMCSCGLENETSILYFLCCPHYITQMFDYLRKISSDITVLPEEHLCHFLMYVNVLKSICNKLMIEQSNSVHKKHAGD